MKLQTLAPERITFTWQQGGRASQTEKPFVPGTKKEEEVEERAPAPPQLLQGRFPVQKLDEDGNWVNDEVIYLTAIDYSGIRCSKAGSDSYEWEISFSDDGQYERAAEFMEWAGERMDNFRFASNKNFWQDFLGGAVNVERFQQFLEGTDNGTPNYLIRCGDSDYIDKDKAQWAKYMNPPGARMYPAREMEEMVAAEIEKNQAKLKKLSAPEDSGNQIFGQKMFARVLHEWEKKQRAR